MKGSVKMWVKIMQIWAAANQPVSNTALWFFTL